MSGAAWIKLQTDVFECRKFRVLPDARTKNEYILVWIRLLCLAGEVNANGAIMFTDTKPYTREMMASNFGINEDDFEGIIDFFIDAEMLTVNENKAFCISNWSKYQNAEKLAAMSHAERQAKYRQKKQSDAKVTQSDDCVTCEVTTRVTKNVTSDALDKDIDIDIDKDIDITNTKRISNKSVGRFSPPTTAEVSEFCKENNLAIDPERFVNFYASKGWMVGKAKMKDWKAAARGWASRDKPKETSGDKYGFNEFNVDGLLDLI